MNTLIENYVCGGRPLHRHCGPDASGDPRSREVKTGFVLRSAGFSQWADTCGSRQCLS
jgi:hypothetical protein